MRRPRPFLAFDGEGIDRRYVLLANSREHLYDPSGLSTLHALTFLTRKEWRRFICVWYGSDYDWSHILRALSDDRLIALYQSERVEWGGFRLELIPHKRLRIWRGGKCWTHYDLSGFFRGPFIQALELAGLPVPNLIRQGKRERSRFYRWTAKRLRAYNLAECLALEQLAERVRDSLSGLTVQSQSLRPRSWHGPGALANKVLRSAEVRGHTYPEVTFTPHFREVLDMAYFGGRIENFYVGTSPGPLYHYDLQSAYGAAMLRLPRLTWRWSFHPEPPEGYPFALYHLRWDLRPYAFWHLAPGPLPWRDTRQYVRFGAEGEGWYWRPEAEIALAAFPGVECLGAWVMDDPPVYPLREPVQELYAMRQELRERDPLAASVLKLTINSLYGKLCQKHRFSRYQSWAWAGYTTAWIRAQMLTAMLMAPQDILACLTDGLLSRRRLPLRIGDGLGEWRETVYEGGLVLRPGIYRLGLKNAEKTLRRWRGFQVQRFPYYRLVDEIKQQGYGKVTFRLFVSHLMAILAPDLYGPDRLRFVEETHPLYPLRSHKRHFYAYEKGSPEGPLNLARRLVGSRLVCGPLDQPIPPSAPYHYSDLPDINRVWNDSLEGVLSDVG